MSKEGAEAFGEYLANFIAHSARYPDATTLAREAGLSPSALSRQINGKERPSWRTLQKLAPLMGVAFNDLQAIAYPETLIEAPTEPVNRVDPIAAELAAMLSEDSPLPDDDRAALRALVEHLIAPKRRLMRRRRPA